MATTQKLQVTELDFDNIKDNFKTFLKGQTEFSDYDLEGSGMNVLMDLLAYNTHYLAYNLNMAVNESFLNRASLRSSVVSHAKTLGYIPNSSRSPVAYVNITVNDLSLNQATLQKGTTFTTSVDEVEYTFVTIADYTISRTSGILQFTNIPLYEGTMITTKYTVDLNDVDQKFLIMSDKVDTNTLKVYVQSSSSDLTLVPYFLTKSISNIDGSSEVFFLQEIENDYYEIYFGDGTYGKKITNGSIITLEYVVTNESAANNASSFSMVGNISGANDVTIVSLSPASGGDTKESIESIKRYAPLYFSTQNRIVTVNDYKSILPKLYSNIDSLKVWGGEDHDVPSYGNVYITIKPYGSNALTDTQKEQVRTLLKPYTIASTQQTFLDPEIVSVFLSIDFNYDESLTNKGLSDLETLVRLAVLNYADTELEKFDTVLKYSVLTDIINAADDSIVSSNLRYNLSKSINPILNAAKKYTVHFNNPIYHPHMGHIPVLISTAFKITNSAETYYINDDGNGKLRLYYIQSGDKVYVDNSFGTINYNTGEIIITTLNVSSTSNTDNSIRLIVIPNYSDIYSLRQQILTIDSNNLVISGIKDSTIRSVVSDQHGLFDSFNITKQDSFID
jgi:hypothetical protein